MCPSTSRRLAVSRCAAQGLDGSQSGVLETVRRLGFLQLDPISSVAPPQHLVLWSRLGSFDVAELDRLLWEERKLVEWNAFLYPIEDLPLLKAFMRRNDRPIDARRRAYLRANSAFSRYVLKELRERGPLLSRDIETHQSRAGKDRHRWWGVREMGLMLEVLAEVGKVTVVGRRGKQRVWDLAERWYPETPALPLREALAIYEEQRFCALGVRLERGRLVAHPDAVDGPVPDRITFLSPFDRLIHDRDRAEALWDFYYRPRDVRARRRSGSTATTCCRSSAATSSSGGSSRSSTARRSSYSVKGLWWEKGQEPLDLTEPLIDLERFGYTSP